MFIRVFLLWAFLAVIDGPNHWKTIASPMSPAVTAGTGEIEELGNAGGRASAHFSDESALFESLKRLQEPDQPKFKFSEIEESEEISRPQLTSGKVALGKLKTPSKWVSKKIDGFRGWIRKFQTTKKPTIDPTIETKDYIEELTTSRNSKMFIDANGISKKIGDSNNKPLKDAVSKFQNPEASLNKQLRQIDKVLEIISKTKSPRERSMAFEVLGLMVDPFPGQPLRAHVLVKIRYALMDMMNTESANVRTSRILDAYLLQRYWTMPATYKEFLRLQLEFVPWGLELLAPTEAVRRLNYIKFPAKYRAVNSGKFAARLRSSEKFRSYDAQQLSTFADIQNFHEIENPIIQHDILKEMKGVLTDRAHWTARERTVTLDALFWIATMPSVSLPNIVKVSAENHIWAVSGIILPSFRSLARTPPVFITTGIETHLKSLAVSMMEALAEKALREDEQIRLGNLARETPENQMEQVQRAIDILPTQKRRFDNNEKQAYDFLYSVSQSGHVTPEAQRAASDAVEYVRTHISITPWTSPSASRMPSPSTFSSRTPPGMSPLRLPQSIQRL